MENKKELLSEYKSSRSLIRDLVMVSREEKLVFRGVSKLEELNPKINRNNFNNKTVDLSKNEFELLYNFRKFALSFMNGNLDFLDIIAYAQHFGLPTRLIDWTRNPFVALFFACKYSKNIDSVYLFYTSLEEHTLIDSSYSDDVNETLTFSSNDSNNNLISEYSSFLKSLSETEKLGKAVKNKNEYLLSKGIVNGSHVVENGLIFYECNASNPRLIAQQGLFSIPISIENDYAQTEIIEKTKCIKISLSEIERNELLKFLDNMNYNGIRLFPDIQNICSNIVFDVLNSLNDKSEL